MALWSIWYGMRLEWKFRVRWNMQLSLYVNSDIPVSCQCDTAATGEGFPMEQMSLTVLCGLSISTNNCLALLPYGKGLKICWGENGTYKQMGTGKKERARAYRAWNVCGKARWEFWSRCLPLSSVMGASIQDLPVISYLKVLFRNFFKWVWVECGSNLLKQRSVAFLVCTKIFSLFKAWNWYVSLKTNSFYFCTPPLRRKGKEKNFNWDKRMDTKTDNDWQRTIEWILPERDRKREKKFF